MGSRWRISGAVVLCLLLSGACQTSDDGTDQTETQEAPPAAETPSPPGGEVDGSPAETEEVIASAEAQLGASGDSGRVRVDITSLSRTAENIVTLEFTLTLIEPTVDGNEELTLLGSFGEGVSDWTVGGISLIDENEQKRYLVYRDTDDKCLCSRTAPAPLLLEEPQDHFASFPAPPESTESVTVVVPMIGSIQDVPISG